MFYPDDSSPVRFRNGSVAPVLSCPASRCFRTAADGSIVLGRNWPSLLQKVRAVGRLAIQTRHAGARLIALADMPALTPWPDGKGAQDEAGSLQFYLARWDQAWGYLQPCECCGSPGRVEFCNAQGIEFFQLCAMPGSDALAWADFLDAAEGRTPGQPRAAPTSLGALPILPDSAIYAAAGGARLIPLLTALGDEGAMVTGMLRTPEACHTREFIPRNPFVDAEILTAGEPRGRVQLLLSAVRGLALHPGPHGWLLYVTGVGDTVLFTFSPPTGRGQMALWHAALRAAFPILG